MRGSFCFAGHCPSGCCRSLGRMSLADLIETSMATLAQRRPVFHSEADFQLALSWQILTSRPDAAIRLEKRVLNDPPVHLDVLATIDGRRYALELKYPKRRLDVTVAGERFQLSDGASDIERYDVIKDVVRCERLVQENVVDEAAALVLTNVPMWQPGRRAQPSGFDAFRLDEGRDLSGELGWGATAGPGTRAQREAPLPLTGSYPLRWRDYSNSDATVSAATFRYLPIVVTGDS